MAEAGKSVKAGLTLRRGLVQPNQCPNRDTNKKTGMTSTFRPTRAPFLTLLVAPCIVAQSSGADAAYGADCNPRADRAIAETTLDFGGQSRIAWPLDPPGDVPLLVVGLESGVDVRLEVALGGVRLAHTVDSPMRRWGPQRVLLEPTRGRGVEISVFRKDEGRGKATIRVFALDAADAKSACFQAQLQLSDGDAHYAQAQRISLGEIEAPPGRAKREYEAAIRAYREAAARMRPRGPGRVLAQAEMSAAAAVYQGAAAYPEAFLIAQRAEHEFEAIADEYGADRARAMRAAAQIEVALDQPKSSGAQPTGQSRTAALLADARATFARVAEGHERRREYFEQALALNNIGIAFYYSNEYDDAIRSYGRAFAIYEKIGERSREAQVMQNMALVQDEVGRFADARASYARALHLIDPVTSAQLYADVLNNLALAEQRSGRPDDALRHYSEALAMLMKLQSTREQARSLHGIGSIYYDIGNRTEALSYFTRALELRRAESDPLGRLASLRALGDVLRDSGDAAGASSRHDEALRLAPTAKWRARVLVDLARDALLGGDHARAAGYLAEVLRDDAGGDPVIYARALLERARLDLATREYDAAERAVLQARQLFDSQELTRSAFAAELLESRIACARGDADGAAKAADDAIRRSETLRRASGSPMLRAALWQPLRAAFDMRIELLAQAHPCGKATVKDGALAALEVAESSRSRALEDFRELASVRDPAISTPAQRRRAERFEALAEKRAQVEALSDQSVENAPALHALLAEIAELRRQIDILDAEIGAALRPREGRIPPARKVTEMIPAHVAVVEYWLGEKNSYAWLVTRERVRMIELGPTNRIEATARAFHVALREFGRFPLRERLGRGRALSDLIIAPFQAELRRIREIRFVPDGALHAIPFAALTFETGGDQRFLVEDHDVAVSPSIHDMRQAAQPARPAGAYDVLVVADPVYSRDDARFDTGTRSAEETTARAASPTLRGRSGESRDDRHVWPRLPAAGREAAAIAARFPPGRVRLMSGFEASREELLKLDLGVFRILHFATHAVADTEVPHLSALILSTRDAKGHPLPGEVFAGDLLQRRLDADLVVLSACDTSIGQTSAGEGLLGLRYAAHAGGARSVVASLWPVADMVGERIMNGMYDAIVLEKRAPAAALAVAMKDARGRWPDPALWAVFEISAVSGGRTIH